MKQLVLKLLGNFYIARHLRRTDGLKEIAALKKAIEDAPETRAAALERKAEIDALVASLPAGEAQLAERDIISHTHLEGLRAAF